MDNEYVNLWDDNIMRNNFDVLEITTTQLPKGLTPDEKMKAAGYKLSREDAFNEILNNLKGYKKIPAPTYQMPEDLYDACMLAKELSHDGIYGGLANYKAGIRYGYTASEVGIARNKLKNNL